MSATPAADPAAATAQFQAKIQERVRQSIGDLLPDDVLADIVREGVKQAFFAPRKVQEPGWGRGTTDAEPWVVEFVRALTKEAVLDHLKRWAAENPDEIRRVVEKTIGDGLFRAFASALMDLFRQPLAAFKDEIHETLNKLEDR